MIPAEQIENAEVRSMAREAEAFLVSHDWCAEVVSVHLGWAIAGVLGVFQIRLIPNEVGVDETLWVVVGDLPPAYLVLDDAPNWREALHEYIIEMRKWVDAVRHGYSLEEIIPVSAAPTLEHAQMLDGRLSFIEQEILATPDGALESDA